MATPEEDLLFRVPTGSTGPGEEVISDVFQGTEKLELGDPRLEGVNISDLQVGEAPEGFQTTFKPAVIMSDAAQAEAPEDPAIADQKEIERLERKKRLQELRSEVEPEEGAPEAESLVDQFGKLREEKGLPGFESELNQLTQQIRELQADAREQAFDAEGKPQQLGALRGEQRKIAEDAQRQIDRLSLRRQAVVDQVNTANSAISKIMELTQQDFQNARQTYNEEFNRNLTFVNMLNADQSKEQQEALVNWQLFAQQYEKAGRTWDSLTPEEQAQIEGLAIRAGIPGASQFIGAVAPPGELSVQNIGGFQILRNDKGEIISTRTLSTKSSIDTSTPTRTNWVNQGLSSNLLTRSDKLTKGSFDKIVNAGVPVDIVEDITELITEGHSLDIVRAGLEKVFGRDTGFGYLDTYMNTLQSDTSESDTSGGREV